VRTFDTAGIQDSVLRPIHTWRVCGRAVKNFRCPWEEKRAPWHPLGYLCLMGSGGVMINPNNWGTTAEFFEAVSR
jgi:hypothetical protein